MDSLPSLFAFEMDPVELVLRGTAVYWLLFLLFRFVLRRDAGSMGIADILLVVLIADASQNAMAGGYQTLADGLVLVSTIAGWNWLIDWAGYRFRPIRQFLEAAPVVLVRHGQLVRRNLRREMISTPELMALLREHGVTKLAEVNHARMEGDGQISVIRVPASESATDNNAVGPIGA
jgi:uncharacterized membrane protein YcaP (DUF421 family)